jgi:23S rRNA (adenine2030-N6)-methyltransferase
MPNRLQYDHARKAGNRGDVWKHFLLVTVIDCLEVPERFQYVDLHCGAPLHELQPRGEWKNGIGKALTECAALKHSPYFEIASSFVTKRQYPAAWWFAMTRLAPRSRYVDLVLTDTAEDVAHRYDQPDFPGLPPHVSPCFSREDGFHRVQDLGEADFVLLDPPFSPDAAADWKRIAIASCQLLKRQIRFLAWYPVFSVSNPKRLVEATNCSGWEVIWARFGPKPSQNLKGCGMLASPQLADILERSRDTLQSLASCLGGNLNVRQRTA